MAKKLVEINGKYYDFSTSNKSFLLTAKELKTLGIKNWYFMLEVKFPDLGVQDLDPFAEDLSAEDVAKIHMESKANLWYWVRECARVPAQGAPAPFQVYLHRASCAAVWLFDHSVDFLLCQPRQTFKTTIMIVLTVYAFIYEYKNVTIPFLHLREKDVTRNALMFRDYIDALPPYMNPFFGMKRPPGVKSMSYDAHKTKITLLSAPDSDVNAKDKMRGMTLLFGFIDEWEYIPYNDDVISGATPAIGQGRAIAKSMGVRSCMMYGSTPGNLETTTGKAAQRIIDRTPKWSEQYYDFTEEEIARSFDGVVQEGQDGVKEQITMLYVEYDRVQLRKSDAWLQEQYMEAARTGKFAEYRRGVLLERFRGADTVLFDQRNIDYMEKHIRKPDHDIMVLKKFHLYVYDHTIECPDLTSPYPYFDANIPYLIGMDIAAGGDGDNTTMCVVHPYTMEVCAELSSPYIGVLDLMRLITEVAQIIPRGVFCPETNSIGKAIVDFVQESQLEYRFYHDTRLDISKNPVIKDDSIESALAKKAKEKAYIGTYVTPSVRQNMYALLKSHVKEYYTLLNTQLLVKDITCLVSIKGKVQADAGEHDDMVMAYLHAIYVLYYGEKLSRFGIDKKLRSFQKVTEIIHQYDAIVAEKVIDNSLPEDGFEYERQILNDMTTPAIPSGTVDEYGYRNDQYRSRSLPNIESAGSRLTNSDYAFFRSVN